MVCRDSLKDNQMDLFLPYFKMALFMRVHRTVALIALCTILFQYPKFTSAKNRPTRSDQTPVVATGTLDGPADNAEAAGDGSGPDADDEPPQLKQQKKLLKIYKEHFREKRKEQISVAESLVAKSDYSRQYSLAKALMDQVFRQLRQSQKNLTDIVLIELPPIPAQNMSILDSLVNVWENTALLGDVILRLPDISHRMIDNHKLRREVLSWAVHLCQDSPVYLEEHRKQLELVLQEMNMADVPDPSYSNPFSEANMRAKQEEAEETHRLQQLAVDRLRRRRARGPRLSQLRVDL
eukprot:m.508841 g.508841  ORF g.508841 m.508841 type:complete len:294 (+) comp21887_c1_seq5:224-1105(+)